MTLTVPDIAPEDDTLTAALAYASAGWYLLPVARGQKKPGSIVGNNWHTKSSRDPKTIAAWYAGTDHGIALHVGRSGAVVLDVDTPDNLPAVILEALQVSPPPAQTTRTGDPRRAHYIYTQPAGRILGNGTGQLGGTWGEIRGLNGVIIVAPSLHADAAEGGIYTWVRTGTVPALPESLAALLHDSTNATDCATDTAVAAFITSYTTSSRPELLEGWQRLFAERAKAGESRHDRMLSVLTGALKEAATGHLAAGTTITALRTDFITAATTEPVGRQGHARTPGEAADEFHGILSWAVAQANAANPAQTRERLARTQPTVGGTSSTPPMRHLAPVPASTGTTGAVPAPKPEKAPSSHLSVVPDDADLTAAIALRHGPTEDGTARALVEQHADRIRYCPQRGRWLAWTGQRWAWDEAETVRELVRGIARALPEDKAWSNYKRRAMSASGVAGITRLAQSDAAITVNVDDLDARPWELNTPGGVVNLRTGQLGPADPRGLHTRMTTVAPDSAQLTGDDDFSTFLHDTFAGDTALCSYMQRLFGLSLIGVVLEQVMPLLHGPGANGKTTLTEAVAGCLGHGDGGYSMSLPAEALMLRKNEQHPAELAQLLGARLVICSELDDGQRFAEARVKMLTGGDRINARFMRRDPFTFTPSHTLLLLGNHRPETSAGGPAFWRRIRLLPFNHTVPAEERDPHLAQKLNDLAPAVLAWAVQGAADYAAHGLQEPGSVLVATADYAADQDTVSRFLEECCNLGGAPVVKIKTSLLRTAYETWCRQAGETAVSPRGLSLALARDHSVSLLKSNGARFYEGVSITQITDDSSRYGERED